jgi:hypothetical protein
MCPPGAGARRQQAARRLVPCHYRVPGKLKTARRLQAAPAGWQAVGRVPAGTQKVGKRAYTARVALWASACCSVLHFGGVSLGSMRSMAHPGRSMARPRAANGAQMALRGWGPATQVQGLPTKHTAGGGKCSNGAQRFGMGASGMACEWGTKDPGMLGEGGPHGHGLWRVRPRGRSVPWGNARAARRAPTAAAPPPQTASAGGSVVLQQRASCGPGAPTQHVMCAARHGALRTARCRRGPRPQTVHSGGAGARWSQRKAI